MAYIGNVPAEKYTALTQQTFSSPTGTSFTLSQAVTNSVDIDLYIDNVKQNPASYSVSGTALTTSTISSPSTMYCIFNGRTTETVNPPDDSVGLSQIASGTDGNLITFDASGNPAYVATGNDGQVLTSAGAGQPCLFEDAAAGGSWNIISTTTASSSSAIDITSGLTSTYSEYAFVLSDFICSTAMAVYMRITIDGGSSYPTSNYQWRNHYLKHDVTTYKSENGAGSNNFHLFDEYDITHFSTILYVSNPSQTTHNKHLRWNSVGYTSSNQTLGIDGCGHYVGATNAINGFKFYPSTGNFTSGRVTLYGIAHA